MQANELHLKAIDKSLLRNPIDMLQRVRRLQAEKETEQQKILEATQKEIEGNWECFIKGADRPGHLWGA